MAALTQQERTVTPEEYLTELQESVDALEERVTLLEAEAARLKARQATATPEDAAPWWKKLVGIYEGDPDFEEVVRLGREYREAQRPPEETEEEYIQADAA